MRSLQRRRRFDQNPLLCAFARPHHDGHGRRQAKGAGAGDDQHGNADGKREFRSLAQQQPDCRRNHRYRHHDWHKNARHFIRQFGNGRFGSRSFLHQLDDFGERRIRADLFGPHGEVAGFVDGGRIERIPRLLLHGQALARQRRFIHRAATLQKHAVHRHSLPRPHRQNIPSLHLFNANFYFLAVPQDDGRFGR